MSREKFRKAIQVCMECFKGGLIGGRMMTPFVCKYCNQEKINSNTNVPNLCVDCGKKANFCVRCLKSMD